MEFYVFWWNKKTFLVAYIFLLHFSKNLFLSSACIKNRCSIIFHGKEICIIHDTSKFKNLICQTFFCETFLNCKILWRKFSKKVFFKSLLLNTKLIFIVLQAVMTIMIESVLEIWSFPSRKNSLNFPRKYSKIAIWQRLEF